MHVHDQVGENHLIDSYMHDMQNVCEMFARKIGLHLGNAYS